MKKRRVPGFALPSQAFTESPNQKTLHLAVDIHSPLVISGTTLLYCQLIFLNAQIVVVVVAVVVGQWAVSFTYLRGLILNRNPGLTNS